MSSGTKFQVESTQFSDTWGISGVVIRHHPKGSFLTQIILHKLALNKDESKSNSSPTQQILTSTPPSVQGPNPRQRIVLPPTCSDIITVPQNNDTDYEEVIYYPNHILTRLETSSHPKCPIQQMFLTFEPFDVSSAVAAGTRLHKYDVEINLYFTDSLPKSTESATQSFLKAEPVWKEWSAQRNNAIVELHGTSTPNQMIVWNDVIQAQIPTTFTATALPSVNNNTTSTTTRRESLHMNQHTRRPTNLLSQPRQSKIIVSDVNTIHTIHPKTEKEKEHHNTTIQQSIVESTQFFYGSFMSWLKYIVVICLLFCGIFIWSTRKPQVNANEVTVNVSAPPLSTEPSTGTKQATMGSRTTIRKNPLPSTNPALSSSSSTATSTTTTASAGATVPNVWATTTSTPAAVLASSTNK